MIGAIVTSLVAMGAWADSGAVQSSASIQIGTDPIGETRQLVHVSVSGGGAGMALTEAQIRQLAGVAAEAACAGPIDIEQAIPVSVERRIELGGQDVESGIAAALDEVEMDNTPLSPMLLVRCED